MSTGVEQFIADMARLGFNPQIEAELVVYVIEPVEGAHAGASVDTGVAIDELTIWPQAPPHWIHLPATVTFDNTNSRESGKSGWLRHSRQLTGWGDITPGIEWASHVRSVVGEATA